MKSSVITKEPAVQLRWLSLFLSHGNIFFMYHIFLQSIKLIIVNLQIRRKHIDILLNHIKAAVTGAIFAI